MGRDKWVKTSEPYVFQVKMDFQARTGKGAPPLYGKQFKFVLEDGVPSPDKGPYLVVYIPAPAPMHPTPTTPTPSTAPAPGTPGSGASETPAATALVGPAPLTASVPLLAASAVFAALDAVTEMPPYLMHTQWAAAYLVPGGIMVGGVTAGSSVWQSATRNRFEWSGGGGRPTGKGLTVPMGGRLPGFFRQGGSLPYSTQGTLKVTP